MTFSISASEPDEQELTFPVTLPDGTTAYCGVDSAGRIDPREAYRPWLRPNTPTRMRPERTER